MSPGSSMEDAHAAAERGSGERYDAACERTRDGGTIRLGRSDGTGEQEEATAKGRTGRITFDRSVPLSVGGKVSDDGEIATSSVDQFNGVVDVVFVEYER